MTVKELIAHLTCFKPEAPVILLPKNEGMVNPFVSITGAWEGFDWQQDKVILATDLDITADFSSVQKDTPQIIAKSKSEYRRMKLMGADVALKTEIDK